MKKRRLFNITDRKVLQQQLETAGLPRTTLSFYRYFRIGEPDSFRERMYATFDDLGVLGRIYVATEGVNAQISIPSSQLDAFTGMLPAFGLAGVRLNLAIEDDGKSFFKLIVRVRDKIVADGLPDDAIDLEQRGTPLSAAGFNALADNPDTMIVDMRNHYESEVGHFERAILPEVATFREALPRVAEMLDAHRDKHIVMYCTGGIRCEKASAYLRMQGFDHVYQLEGGIIEYARQAVQQGLANKFRGKNFVFDERLGERIGEEIIARCHQCGAPADTHVNCANDACHLLFIQCAECREHYRGCCSGQCVEFISLPVEEQRKRRKSEQFNGSRFGKGKYRTFVEGRLTR